MLTTGDLSMLVDLLFMNACPDDLYSEPALELSTFYMNANDRNVNNVGFDSLIRNLPRSY